MGYLVLGIIIGLLLAYLKVFEMLGMFLIFGLLYPAVNFLGRIFARKQ